MKLILVEALHGKNFVASYLDVLPLQNIATHIVRVHASADASSGDPRTTKEDNWLKRFGLSEAFQLVYF